VKEISGKEANHFRFVILDLSFVIEEAADLQCKITNLK
jgi:hypothetical protein